MQGSKKILHLACDARAALDAHGFFQLPRNLRADQVDGIKDRLAELPWRRTPLSDANKSQYWSEADLSEETDIKNAILSTSVNFLVTELKAPPKYMAFWANHYGCGEFIPKHTDNDGGLQLLTGILLSPGCTGGKNVFHHNKTHSVTLAPGRQILFDAKKTPHETTPLKSYTSEPCTRMICVTRFYF